MGLIIKQQGLISNPTGRWDEFTKTVYKFERNGMICRWQTVMNPGRTIGNESIPIAEWKLITKKFTLDFSFINYGRGGSKNYRLFNLREHGFAQIDIYRKEADNKTVLRQVCGNLIRKEYDLGDIKNDQEYKLSISFETNEDGTLAVTNIVKNGISIPCAETGISSVMSLGDRDGFSSIILHGAVLTNPTNDEDAYMSCRYFGYSTNNRKIVSFNFFGKNENESLTDKISGITLKRGGLLTEESTQIVYPYYE